MQHTVKNNETSKPTTYDILAPRKCTQTPTFPLILITHFEPVIQTCHVIPIRTVSKCMRNILSTINFINAIAVGALSWRIQLGTQRLKRVKPQPRWPV